MEERKDDNKPQPLISFVRAGHSDQSVIIRQFPTSGESGEAISEAYKNIVLTSSSSFSSVPPEPQSIKATKPVIRRKVEQWTNATKPLKPNEIFAFCQNGKVEQVQQWLQAKFDVDLRDPFGWTPLMVAACSGHTAIVRLLLEANANHTFTNGKGQSAIDLARKSGHKAVVKLIDDHLNPPLLQQIKEEPDTEPAVRSAVMFDFFECVPCAVQVTTADRTAHELSIAHQLRCGTTSAISEETRQLGNYAHLNRRFKGYELLVKEGWNQRSGLGVREDGRKYPIVAKRKPDRACIGLPQTTARGVVEPQQPPPRVEKIKLKHKLRDQHKRQRRIERNFRNSFRDVEF